MKRMVEKVKQAGGRGRVALLTFVGLFLFYLVAGFFLGDKGLLRYVKLLGERTALKSEIADLKRQNEALREKVESLKTDPSCIESLAREQGMVREDEIIYQYEDE